MKTKSAKYKNVVFSPNLRADDKLANYWMRQATIRVRREIAWLWQERGLGRLAQPGELPPLIDKASETLDFARHSLEKKEFFKNDVAALYLSEQLEEKAPAVKRPKRGSFSWVVNELSLDDVSAFTLALGLASAFDSSFGAVIAACLNDHSRIYPNLMLIQRLWDEPDSVLRIADPMHPLFTYGLLRRSESVQRHYAENAWEHPLTVPTMVARGLMFSSPVLPSGLSLLDPAKVKKGELDRAGTLISHRLKSEKPTRLRLVPLRGKKHSAYRQTVCDLSRLSKRMLWELRGDPALLGNSDYLNTLSTLCWLQDRDLFIDHELLDLAGDARTRNEGLPLVSVPTTIFFPIEGRRQLDHIESDLVFPVINLKSLTYEKRLAIWRSEIKSAKKFDGILVEIARRFRYEKETIEQVCSELNAYPQKLTEDDFIAACRAELSMDMGDLAAFVEPRFEDERLILANKQDRQFEEQFIAMKALTQVHYGWGTARAWNEGGITVLYSGPPGTGKTMAAEIMAQKLKLPMYRIDLSQVVNKYIGETEKNLKRIFDAAEISDIVLFFDEADALFGKRTDVNDSRDRYANLEISYLLERMERFKGLAILATNRKRDLDEAFMRRIRYVTDFTLPGEAQRREIWEQMIPKDVRATSKIDMGFLSRQFPLSGGHIRSIVFNACLQSAYGQGGKELFMKDVLIAVKREYDKMNRSMSLSQLGPYAKDISELD